MKAMRRTKIVATLGPASTDPAVLEEMIIAGVDVVRLNFSHGDVRSFIPLAKTIYVTANKVGRSIAILADLQGPKIRIARFQEDSVILTKGAAFILDASLERSAGDVNQVGIDYPQLVTDVSPEDTLLLDDGRIVLTVEQVIEQAIHCTVKVGGVLSNNKGINRLGGGLSAAALSEKDRADIEIAAQIDADYVAVSFPRAAEDLIQARALLRAAGGEGGIVAKLERAEAIEAMDDIIRASDAVMVARGDLGVEIGDASLPPIQKKIIKRARSLNRAVITATQMMESMIENAIPTRAEVFDVANAVLDGTDAVMLSGETAVGNHPVAVIEAVDRVCLQAEQQREIRVSDHRIDSEFARVDEAIAMAGMYLANHMRVAAIGALTSSGITVMWMSRISSGIPIFAITSNEKTSRKVALYRGVYPIKAPVIPADKITVTQPLIELLKQNGVIEDGDTVILTRGDIHAQGNTNTLKIVEVGAPC